MKSYMSAPDAVLMCGCIYSTWGEITRNGKSYVLCERHVEEPQEVIREANITDLLEIHRKGPPAVQEILW